MTAIVVQPAVFDLGVFHAILFGVKFTGNGVHDFRSLQIINNALSDGVTQGKLSLSDGECLMQWLSLLLDPAKKERVEEGVSLMQQEERPVNHGRDWEGDPRWAKTAPQESKVDEVNPSDLVWEERLNETILDNELLLRKIFSDNKISGATTIKVYDLLNLQDWRKWLKRPRTELGLHHLKQSLLTLISELTRPSPLESFRIAHKVFVTKWVLTE